MKYIAKIALLIVIAATACPAYAKLSGQQLIDSLLKELPKAKEDTNKCKILNEISFQYKQIDPDKGITFGREDSLLTEKLHWKKGTAGADNVLGANYATKSDFNSAIFYFDKSLNLDEEIDFKKGVATISGNIGIIYQRLGDHSKAIEYYTKSLKMNEEIGNKRGTALTMGNIGSVYLEEGNYPKALDYFINNLKVMEELGDKSGMCAPLENIGVEYFYMKNYPKALEYYSKQLKVAEEIGDKMNIANATEAIGTVYSEQGNFTKGIEYCLKALKVAEDIGDKRGMAQACMNLGTGYGNLKNYIAGISYGQRAVAIYKEIGEQRGIGMSLQQIGDNYLSMIKDSGKVPVSSELPNGQYISDGNIPIGKTARLKLATNYLREGLNIAAEIKDEGNMQRCYSSLANAYRLSNDYKTALMYTDSANIYKDSVFNSDNDKKIANIESRRKEELDSAKTAAFQREVAIKEQHHRNYMYMAGGVIVLLLGFTTLLTRNNKLLSKERKKSDDLLLNILPEEVAGQLKEHGNAAAKHYDNVTVLFTDFVNFTSTSERMTPHALVEELHTCFQKFDEIMERHNLEKIKTIGDAYLAAAGLPTADAHHATHAVQAAIEIRAYMEDRYAKLGDSTFQVRIGIHSGSVVAGIVGSKKFAYDIWGDTVNTAARMEQHSEPGRINISEVTYQLVHNKFSCEYRGEIAAKGKGMMKMYYV